MPPAADPPKPKPKGKGAGLKRKVGPLPLWAWLAIVGGGVAVWYLFLRERGGEGGGPVELVSGYRPASPQEAASSGAPASNGALASQVDPAVLDTLVQEAVSPYLASAGDLRGHVTELEDAFARAGFEVQEDKTWSVPGSSTSAYSEVYDPLFDRLEAIISGYGGVQSSPAPKPKPGRPPRKTQPKPKRKPPRKPKAGKPKPPRKPKAKPPQKGARPKPKPPRKPPPPRRRPARRGGGPARVM